MSIYVRVYADASTGGSGVGTANATYATAREATPAFISDVDVAVGQVFSGGTYRCDQYLGVFDTSSVSGSVTTTTLSLSVSTAPTTLGDTLEVRAVSGITNLVAGSSLASQTPLYGSLAMAAGTGRKGITLDISAMPRTSSCQMLVSSLKQRTNVAPTTTTERTIFSTAQTSGTTNDPFLSIVAGTAWSLVGVGTVATPVTATPLTLTEPAGVADGDLLVACIASRTTATTAVTATGWTAVGSQNNNNTLTTGSAIASGTMLYRVRSGTPTLSFTLPTGISVAMGAIVAYRGNAATTPLDASTAVTAAAGTAVSVTGLTTTQDDDLIVAMAAGGQEAAWSAFNNVTTPIGASGATDTVTAPSTTAWIERADSVTTTGADTSLGIFDAVRTGTGATGNLTVTGSVSAGHVVIAGAFKIYVPPTADAWNRYDKSANITLSASDKIATSTSGTLGGVRSTTTYVNGTAGKYYAEFVRNGFTSGYGIGLATSALTTTPVINVQTNGSVFINGVFSGTIGTWADGDVLSIAWDAGAERVWCRANANNWNNDSSANPATGTNGLDASALTAAAHALTALSGSSGASVTLRTELAEYTQAVPSGFTSWMGEVPPTADAWNKDDKSANITLSASDKTATTTSATSLGVRSTTTHLHGAVGKFYAEFLCSTVAGSNLRLGVHTLTDTITSPVVGLDTRDIDGGIFRNNSSVGSVGSALTSGDVLCFAWDTGAELFWFRKNGGNWNNTAGYDPAAGVGGISSSVTVDTNHALYMYSSASGNSATLRTELAEYTQAVPSGFTSWMGETPAGGGISVPVTGVSATGAVGSVTVATVASVAAPVTGVEATGQVGDVTAIGRTPVSVAVTGVQATGAVDAVTIVGKANVPLTGVAAGGFAGSVTVTAAAGVSVPVTGVEATGAIGTVTVSTVTRVDVSTPVTGVAATGSVGTATVTGKASTIVTGVQAAGAVGTVTVTAGTGVSVPVTGLQATGAVGTATASGKAVTIVTGVAATGSVGSVTVTAGTGVTVPVTGVAATGSVDSVSITGKANIPLTGVAASGTVGGVSVVAGGSISTTVTGVQAAGAVGTVTIVTEAEVPVTGVQAVASVGSVTVAAEELAGLVSVWNGSAWVDKPAKVWSGSAWQQKPVKHWDGSAWV